MTHPFFCFVLFTKGTKEPNFLIYARLRSRKRAKFFFWRGWRLTGWHPFPKTIHTRVCEIYKQGCQPSACQPSKTSFIRSDTIRHPPIYLPFVVHLRSIYITTSLPLRNVQGLLQTLCIFVAYLRQLSINPLKPLEAGERGVWRRAQRLSRCTNVRRKKNRSIWAIFLV